MKNVIDREAGKDLLNYARKGRLDGLRDWYESTKTDWATRVFQTRMTPASTGMPFETWKNWMSKKEIQKQFELQFVNPQDIKRINNLQMLKPIAGLAFNQGASMIGNYAM